MSHGTGVSYVFGDLLTGAVIDEISLQGVSMTRGFGGGELRGTLHLDQTGKDNRDLLAASEPGRCYVVCQRGDQPIWGGFVWVRTYQSQAKSIQLYCRSFEHYPEYRVIRTDLSYEGIEQRNIFRELWTSMMADPNSLQVSLPSAFSTVITKDLEVKSFEFKTYSQVMSEIADGSDGFDWTIDVAQVDGVFTRTLRVGYPTLGSTEPLVMYYPGDILNYWRNDSMADRGTHIYGVGAGEGSTMLVQEVIHSDLVGSGFPRYDMDLSYKSISDPALLTSLTVQAASVRKATLPVMTVELKADKEIEFGSFGLGDAVRMYINDSRHPDPNQQLFVTRIIGWEYYPPSDEHTEMVRLSFEGAEL